MEKKAEHEMETAIILGVICSYIVAGHGFPLGNLSGTILNH